MVATTFPKCMICKNISYEGVCETCKKTMKTKTIWDYFVHNIDYPENIVHNPIPYGTVYCYISSKFLEAFIRYVEPICCFRLEFIEDEYGNIEEIISEVGKYNIEIKDFSDDITLLAEIPSNNTDGKGRYIFFWFQSDVSDCCIGKFETIDSKEQVIQSVKNWLDFKKLEDEINNYTEIPVEHLNI